MSKKDDVIEISEGDLSIALEADRKAMDSLDTMHAIYGAIYRVMRQGLNREQFLNVAELAWDVCAQKRDDLGVQFLEGLERDRLAALVRADGVGKA